MESGKKERILMNKEEEAKSMYFNYGCSKFKMDADGVLETYKAFNISKDQEQLWATEKLEETLDQMREALDYTTLRKVMELIGKTHRFEFVETVYDVLELHRGSIDGYSFSKLCSKFISEVERMKDKGYDGEEYIKKAEIFINS